MSWWQVLLAALAAVGVVQGLINMIRDAYVKAQIAVRRATWEDAAAVDEAEQAADKAAALRAAFRKN